MHLLMMEKMELRELGCITKLAGTTISLADAMVMTLSKIPVLRTGSSREERHHGLQMGSVDEDWVEGTVVALAMERGSMAAWSIGWDVKLLVIVYAAVVGSGLVYCFQGSVVKQRGPVFVAAFTPLIMIIVAIAGLYFLAEDLTVGI